jgi:hypothetical protein
MSKMKFVLLLFAAIVPVSALVLAPRGAAISTHDKPEAQPLEPTGNSEKTVNPDVALRNSNESSVAQNDQIEVEVITATSVGFEPQALTRPRGAFILAVHNRSGEPELELRVARTQGERLHELRLGGGRRSQHQRLNLPPGDYVISETGHPDWRCTLTITH